jgi:hypothetical protein
MAKLHASPRDQVKKVKTEGGSLLEEDFVFLNGFYSLLCIPLSPPTAHCCAAR